MRNGPKRIITWVLICLSAVLLSYYVYIESRDFLTGPSISVAYPINQSEVYGPEVEVRGKTERVSSITLNNSPIFIDEKGVFREKLILPNGYTIIQLEAKDRFGKTAGLRLEFTVTSTPESIIN
jgi:hypothetical protein